MRITRLFRWVLRHPILTGIIMTFVESFFDREHRTAYRTPVRRSWWRRTVE